MAPKKTQVTQSKGHNVAQPQAAPRKARTPRALTASEMALAALIVKAQNSDLTDAEKTRKKELTKAVRAETFSRLGSARLRKAVKAIQQVGLLAGYEYTEGQVKKVEDVLADAVAKALSKFSKDGDAGTDASAFAL